MTIRTIRNAFLLNAFLKSRMIDVTAVTRRRIRDALPVFQRVSAGASGTRYAARAAGTLRAVCDRRRAGRACSVGIAQVISGVASYAVVFCRMTVITIRNAFLLNAFFNGRVIYLSAGTCRFIRHALSVFQRVSCVAGQTGYS